MRSSIPGALTQPKCRFLRLFVYNKKLISIFRFLSFCTAPVLIAVIVFKISWHHEKEAAFAKKFEAISPEDRFDLEAFFRLLILKEGGGYVLFGNKPVAFTAFSPHNNDSMGLRQIIRYDQDNKIISKGWQTWEKYAPLFRSRQFILECRKFHDNRFEICLIKKDRFKQIVKTNLPHFQSILGDKITPDILLSSYCKNDQPLFHLLKRHHALLGILLGFGTENSWLFHENTRLNSEDPNATGRNLLKAIQPYPTHLCNHTLQGLFNERNHRKCFKFLYLPYFFADPNSEESQILKEQYIQQQRTIHNAYAHGHFLEVTLRKFCQ